MDVWIIVVDITVLVTLSQSDAGTWGYRFIVCLFDFCIQKSPASTIIKKNKKGVGGRGEGLLIQGKHSLFFGHKHRVMTPDQKKWKKMAKVYCVTIV